MSEDTNIDETKAQLEMIETALRSDPTNSDLLQLKTDLITLLSLLDSKDEDTSSNSNETKSNQVQSDELTKLEGQKVRASVSEKSKHELGVAVIISAEADNQIYSERDDIVLRLVFCHPTSERLVPCKYYLDGRCNRVNRDCRWSHGEIREVNYNGFYNVIRIFC